MKQRSIYITNLKLILIFTVVLGHTLEWHISSSVVCEAVYRTIYSFHMPLFAFVSGLTMGDARACLKGARRTSTLFVLIQTGVILVALIAGMNSVARELLYTPFWHLWYLFSLAVWYLIVGLVKKLLEGRSDKTRNVVCVGVLALSFVIAVACGLAPFINRVASASRALVFLPFLLVGAFLGRGIVRALMGAYRLLFVSVPISALCIVALYKMTREVLYNAQSYASCGISDATGLCLRLIYLVGAAALSVTVLILCPNKKTVVTPLGTDTLPVYILHPLLALGASYIPYIDYFGLLIYAILSAAFIVAVYFIFRRRDIRYEYVTTI